MKKKQHSKTKKAKSTQWGQEKIKKNRRFLNRFLLLMIEIAILALVVGTLVHIMRKNHPVQEEQPTEEETLTLPEEETILVTEPVTVEETREAVTEEEMDPEKETVLTFAGDISFAEGYAIMGYLAQREHGIQDCFDEFIWKEMQEADLFTVNNEFPYSNRGIPIENKTFTFRAKPESATLLKDMGVDMVSLGNNHIYDYGEEAVIDTIDTLDGIGMPHAGAGKNREEAMRPAIFTENGLKIAYVCATQVEQLDNPDTKAATDTSPGAFRCYNDNSIYEVVREAKKENDFVICYIHWGQELAEELNWLQTDQAEKLVEAGADLIVGAHPHILQGVDIMKGVPVIYSLGNFWFNSKTFDTALLKVTLKGGKIVSLQMLPAIQSGCTTTMAGDADRERIISYLQSHSPNVTIDAAGRITAK